MKFKHSRQTLRASRGVVANPTGRADEARQPLGPGRGSASAAGIDRNQVDGARYPPDIAHMAWDASEVDLPLTAPAMPAPCFVAHQLPRVEACLRCWAAVDPTVHLDLESAFRLRYGQGRA